jgi:uncharacterized protein (TIGR02444 family)
LSLVDFAFERYARSGVKDRLLALQDEHGQSAPLLLWAAWARTGDPRIAARAAAIARQWEDGVVAHLRAARRDLRSPAGDAGRQAVKAMVQEAEIAAETLLLDELGQLPPAAVAPMTEALACAAAAWGDPPPREALDDLASLLG